MTATKKSWKTLNFPSITEKLGYSKDYSDSDAKKLMVGFVPKQMEDKWFIYFDNGWLYLLRSWTGIYIYGLKLDRSPTGVNITDSWVNRDPNQYNENDIEYDRKMAAFLIDVILLNLPAKFPKKSNIIESHPGILQHSVVGLACPEILHIPKDKN
ncbi:MAG: hypothetical protein GPJ29_15900 [Microcystis aeruginosa BK11-02]|jgi:hypothetical protein|nr:hypothetical protein [Microcystis aeruginosa BK11-02]